MNAFGLRGGYLFEDDDFSANTGNIHWDFTDPILYWTGAVDTKWDDLNNWDDGAGGTGVPNQITRVFIPDVSAASTHNPIIDQSNARTKSVTIYSGGDLTIQSDFDLQITQSLENSGVFSIDETSNTLINVGDKWVCAGAFNSGSGSSVIFEATGGVVNITTNAQAFNNVQFKTSGAAEYKTLDAFTTKGNLEILQGIFTVSDASHAISVGSMWNNVSVFNHGGADIIFNGNNNQNKIIQVQEVSTIRFSAEAELKLYCQILRLITI